jgi:hypothetical protein
MNENVQASRKYQTDGDMLEEIMRSKNDDDSLSGDIKSDRNASSKK